MNRIQELREERVTLITEARAWYDELEAKKKADDEISADDESRFDTMMDQADKMKREIDQLERLDDAEKSLTERAEIRAGREDISVAHAEQKALDENEAFRKWIAFGMEALNPEERAFMGTLRANTTPEMRAQSVGTTTAGGFLVPEDFSNALERSMLAFGGMREAATILPTGDGADLPWPTTDDTSNKGAILAENTQDSEQDITFGSITFGAFMYTSKIVRVSLQLIQDSFIDVDSLLADMLGERIARATNEHFTTGTGSGQPNGIVTASGAGVTAALTTAITHDELLDLKHSVDPAYRAQGGRWMWNDATLKAVKKLKDDQSRPLWQPGIALREPDTFDGDGYVINQDMASIGQSTKPVLYGALSKYLIRDVLGVQVMRLTERYADYLQVGFISFSRHDGDLLDAGTDPVKHLVHQSG